MNEALSDEMAGVLDRIQKLPSMPAIVTDILASFDNEQIDVATMVQKISRDQAIVARVMRVANSAFFGLSGQVGSISEAIAVLGFNNLRSLVVAAAMIDAFPHFEETGNSLPFWHHSIGTATCARVLAKRVGIHQETAFLAGLLHDIGWLVMMVYLPQTQVVPRQCHGDTVDQMLAAERVAFGFDHAMLGGAVARRWHLPEAIAEAIRLHHEPERPHADIGLTDVTYIANLVSCELGNAFAEENLALDVVTETQHRLGLDHRAIADLLPEMKKRYDGAISLNGE